MATRNEYQMAYRAMRKWWKLVEGDNHPMLSSDTRRHYKNICDSYNTKELLAAMNSITARRNAEYMAENPDHARAIQRWQRSLKNQPPQEIPF